MTSQKLFDIELDFINKKKRIGLIYFVSTKSNTIATFVDLVTKKNFLIFSTGEACSIQKDEDEEEEEKEAEKEAEKEKEALKKKTPPKRIVPVGKRKQKRLDREAKKKEKEKEEGKKEEEKDTSFGRIYRRGMQAQRLFSVELLNKFIEYLVWFKKFYGFFILYRFYVYFKGPSKFRRFLLLDFFKKKLFKIIAFGDIGLTPHNGCRAPKKRRSKAKKKRSKRPQRKNIRSLKLLKKSIHEKKSYI
jgi:ribosomal protein S11